MDYDLIRYAALILGGILFYAILTRGLFNITEPFRWRALEIAEKLKQSSQVSEGRKASLYRRLGEVYSRWTAWKLVLLMICVVFTLPFQKEGTDDDSNMPAYLRSDYQKFKIYWMISTVANDPAATFLFTLMAVIVLAFFASISAISAALAFERDNHDHRHNAAT
jgi:hypothetical protein